MPMIVVEGRPPLPVVYGDWSEWRVARRESAPPPDPGPAAAPFCATCWGQGGILEAARNGEGLIRRVCPTCEGSRIAPHAAGPAAPRGRRSP